jgi:succinate dehydrogenase / fumarate reductase, cytochrome b subunit
MNWFTNFFSSSIGKKLLMSLTGLFLILFLIVHLAGNLQLLHNDGGKAFNIYAQTMTSNPFIKVVSYVNYGMILFHAFVALVITLNNRRARGSQGYAVSNNSSTLSARNMGILGTLILIFIVVHMKHFWAEMHFGNLNLVNYGTDDYKNLYAVVADLYKQQWYVALYVVSMAVLAFHLYHGFGSAFQTLGLNHVKYNGIIRFVGVAFSIVVPVLFALIPVMMYINK